MSVLKQFADTNLRELACLQRYGYHEIMAMDNGDGSSRQWSRECSRCRYSTPRSIRDTPASILWNPNGVLGFEYWVWINGEQYPNNDGRTHLTDETARELAQKGVYANVR